MQPSWPAENILLGLLCERPEHGYEIAQVVQEDEALRAIWRIERSEICSLLGKLSKGGLIMASAAEQAGGPVRVIYAPTETGRAQFFQWLRAPEAKPRNRGPHFRHAYRWLSATIHASPSSYIPIHLRLEEDHETIPVLAHPDYHNVGVVGRVCGPSDVGRDTSPGRKGERAVAGDPDRLGCIQPDRGTHGDR
jgi:DNA-binding PadR family transcriptional regulator